nr:hypothetical protein [Tanacetum cinerariifolium]
DALCLDDAEGIECLPNDEIFTELARMGYEKPSTKLTFYKAFLKPLEVDNLTFQSTFLKGQVGKGCSGVETLLFEGMIVEQPIGEGVEKVHDEDVSTAGFIAEGDASAANDGRMIADMDADADVILEDAKEVAVEKSADVEESAIIQGSMQDDEGEPSKLQEVVEVVTNAKLITEVVTAASATIIVAAPQLTTVAAPTLNIAPSASRRRKGVKEDNVVKRYQALKRKPQTEAQARKNMMIYLRNVAGFKMDYFKGMTYDDIRLVFEKHFDSNVAFLQRIQEQMDEEDSRAFKRMSETQEDKVAKKKKLDKEVEELKRHLQIVPNKEDDVYTKLPLLISRPLLLTMRFTMRTTNHTTKSKELTVHKLYLSFLSLLRNLTERTWKLYGDWLKTRYTCLNLEKSKKCSWSSKSQELEAVRILWCADNYVYNNKVDFAGREEISTHEVHSGLDAK